jgi:O-antigen ligase
MIGEYFGMVAVAGCAAAALLVRDERIRSAAMLIALGLLPVLVIGHFWEGPEVRALRDDPARAAAIAAGVLVGVAALTVAIRRQPLALPLLLLAALPFRIPLHSGGESANLLLPLYVVIAAGAAAAVANGPGREPAATDRWLPRMLAAVVGVYAIQSAYSSGFGAALQDVCFFLVPFALVFALLVGQRWDRRLLGLALGVVVVETVGFALFGYWQHEARELLWNQEVIDGNDVHTYFRVNSVFFDPNIYGRYLVTVMVLACAWLLWTTSARAAALMVVALAILVGALLFTYSQSSYAALLAGLLALAALRWSLRWTLATLGAGLVALVLAIGVGDVGDRVFSSEQSLNKGTSGRVDLIEGGLDLARDQPVFGQGSGAFVRDFRRQEPDAANNATAASHTEPVTVLAEQGAIGFLLYVALLVATVVALGRGLARLAPGLRRGGWRETPESDTAPEAAARAGILAAFFALVVHSLAYDAFLTDPITWTLLAVGVALAPATVVERKGEREAEAVGPTKGATAGASAPA